MNKERYLVWKYWDSVQKRGGATIDGTSGFGFNNITETCYYRFTKSAVGNPVTNAFGIIETVRFGGYIKQTITFRTTKNGAVRQMIRMSTHKDDETGIEVWSNWREVTLTDLA